MSKKKSEEFQNLFVDEIFDGKYSQILLDQIIPLKSKSSKEVLDVYRGDYTARMQDALGERYESCWWILGDEDFINLGQKYIAKYPSVSYDLSDFGEHFSLFLKEETILNEIPFLSDLATFELRFQKLFHQKEEKSINNKEIEEIEDISSIKFEFVENLFINYSSYQVFEVWTHRKDDQSDLEQQVEINWEQEEAVCLFKHNGEILNKILTIAQYKIFSSLIAGHTLEKSITPELEVLLEQTDITDLFSFLVSSHLIKDFS